MLGSILKLLDIIMINIIIIDIYILKNYNKLEIIRIMNKVYFEY